jgi:hypothetical protein
MLLQNQSFCLGRYVCRELQVHVMLRDSLIRGKYRVTRKQVYQMMFLFSFFQQDMHQSRCFSMLT